MGHTSKAKGKGSDLELPGLSRGTEKVHPHQKRGAGSQAGEGKNPRPPKYDPPPASNHPLLIAAVLALALLPLVFLPFWAAQVMVAPPPPGELTLWIHSSAAEFAALQNWLEPELRANGLTWRVEHASSKEELLQAWRSRLVDLAVVEEELAAELHGALALAPLWDKLEGPTWENCFAPFWEAQPFRKTFGWVIPAQGRIPQARHLVTVMRQFAQPFSP